MECARPSGQPAALPRRASRVDGQCDALENDDDDDDDGWDTTEELDYSLGRFARCAHRDREPSHWT